MDVVELAADGAILLRPAGIWPIESYTDERIAELAADGRMTPAEEARVERVITQLRRQ